MGTQYRHLSEEDRLLLGSMLDKRYSKMKIAELLGVDRSTIYREIKRNRLSRVLDKRIYYIGSFAHQRYLKRRNKKLRLLQEKELRHYVHEKLRLGWSPWQIEGSLKREHDCGFYSERTPILFLSRTVILQLRERGFYCIRTLNQRVKLLLSFLQFAMLFVFTHRVTF